MAMSNSKGYGSLSLSLLNEQSKYCSLILSRVFVDKNKIYELGLSWHKDIMQTDCLWLEHFARTKLAAIFSRVAPIKLEPLFATCHFMEQPISNSSISCQLRKPHKIQQIERNTSKFDRIKPTKKQDSAKPSTMFYHFMLSTSQLSCVKSTSRRQ